MKAGATNPLQDELPFSSALAHTVFPGRSNLYVSEVAKALCVTEQQVIDLIQENVDTGGTHGLHAFDIANGVARGKYEGNKTPRRNWRIPVSAFDDFINRRRSDKSA